MKCCVLSCRSYSDRRSDAKNGITFHLGTPESVRKVSPGIRNSPQKQQLPQKVERPRSNSVSAPAPSAPTNRKRTSSGVFQVDESEPPQKKVEVTRSNSDGSRKMTAVIPNGRRKRSVTEEKETPKHGVAEKEKEKKTIEKFDSEAKAKCVAAFKESDSWD